MRIMNREDRKMKKLIIIALATLAAMVSCQKAEQEVVDTNPAKGDLVFTATIDATKTTVNTTNGKVSWEADDVITITDAGSNSAVYGVSEIVADRATFTKQSGSTLGAGPYTAVYGEAPSTSTPQVYSATVTDLPMTASSATTSLTFSVSCGLLKVSLTDAGTSISSIAVGDGTNVYTLNCSPAVNISSGADFYIAVPAGTYKRFAFQKSDGKYCVKTAKPGKETTVAANDIKPISFSSLNFNTTLVHNISELTTALSGVADGDKILLASGTYTLSSTISITNAITLEGGYSASPSAADFPNPATNKATLDGAASYRVMTITGPAGKTVNLSGLVLQNGNNTIENAAGLFVNQGTACLNHVDIKNNTGSKMGIGFTVTGTGTNVSFSNSVISGNTTTGNGSNYIYKAGSVSFDDCLFSDNSSPQGGGLYIYTDAANSMTVQITNSEFRNNTSNGRGGGIYLRCNAATTITLNVANSTFPLSNFQYYHVFPLVFLNYQLLLYLVYYLFLILYHELIQSIPLHRLH